MTRWIASVLVVLVGLGSVSCVAPVGGGAKLVDGVDGLADVIAGAQPGDGIVIPDGLYRDLRISFTANGERTRPVVLRPETPGGVVLTGNSHISISGSHLVVDGFVFDQAWGGNIVGFLGAQDCRLTNCAFVECGNPKSSYSHIVTLRRGSSRNRVDHCYMQGNLSMGVGTWLRKNDYENTHNRIDHNCFRDIVRRHHNGQEAVQLGQGGFSDRMPQYQTVERNLFWKASGDAEIISNKSSNNTIRHNTFRDCKAMLVLRGGNHVRVEGNIILGGSGGIRVHGSQHTIVNNYIAGCKGDGIYMPNGARHYAPINFCVVAHNTIVNCGRGIYIGRSNPHPSTTWQLKPVFNDFLKNLIVSDRGVLIQDDDSHVSMWRGNIVWAHGGASAGVTNEGIKVADPGLVQSDGMWRLPGRNSCAVDTPSVDFRDLNAPVPGAAVDIDGDPREAAATDVGCDEVAATGNSPCRPLALGDVGPVWMVGDPTRITRIPDPKPIPPIKRK